jgi:hypothetical protein
MMDSIHLIGAETVSSAARTMAGAASEMNTTAYNIECTMQRHREFLDDWLQRFTHALNDHAARVASPPIIIEPAPITEQDPEASPTAEEQVAIGRRFTRPSPTLPCVLCQTIHDPGETGCGNTKCPHDNIPF